MSISPFELEPPNNMRERVQDFARDLAYGVTLGLWHTKIQWHKLLNPEISAISKIFAEELRPKWGTDFPSEYLLLSFGYLQEIDKEAGFSTYLLTEKAFQLLESPLQPPDVFISYRRSESSAFGLLIEARLKLAGNPNPFIDKNLVAGDEWSEQLRGQIQKSRYFICLVGQTTLQSEHVLQEITWAHESGCTIISIWHNGTSMNDSILPLLQNRHAITVDAENALGYEIAVNQLLNSMGYTTY
jgi:hypothetical protein